MWGFRDLQNLEPKEGKIIRFLYILNNEKKWKVLEEKIVLEAFFDKKRKK